MVARITQSLNPGNMRTIWIDNNGVKHYARPNNLTVGGVNYAPPTDAQLIDAGWRIETIIDPVPEPYVPTYPERVVQLIRERYTMDDEFAILRQRDSKPTEFAEYNAFCEECKRIAKEGE